MQYGQKDLIIRLSGRLSSAYVEGSYKVWVLETAISQCIGKKCFMIIDAKCMSNFFEDVLVSRVTLKYLASQQ